MTLQINPDKTVPLPVSDEPELAATLREEMQLAANTAAVLKGLGAEYEESPTDQSEADEVFAAFSEIAKQQYNDAMSEKPKAKMGRPRTRLEKITTLIEKVPVAERIGAMLREYNNPIVADAAELRLVVTNKLLDLSSCGDPRIEIKAAEMLGKISDVGLFSEKSEITVTYNNVADIDEAIKDKLRKMMKLQAIDVPVIEKDFSKEFAPSGQDEMSGVNEIVDEINDVKEEPADE